MQKMSKAKKYMYLFAAGFYTVVGLAIVFIFVSSMHYNDTYELVAAVLILPMFLFAIIFSCYCTMRAISRRY